ncbi:hypothetical protein BJX99DRAFT_253971 [Aspergillus californicus]
MAYTGFYGSTYQHIEDVKCYHSDNVCDYPRGRPVDERDCDEWTEGMQIAQGYAVPSAKPDVPLPYDAICLDPRTMCPQCKWEYTTVPKELDSSLVQYPSGIHTFFIDCRFRGTTEEAYKYMRDFTHIIRVKFYKPDLFVHGLIRECTPGSAGVAPWWDITTETAAEKVGNVFSYRWARVNMPPQWAEVKDRELRILVDCPWPLDWSGPIYKNILLAFRGEFEVRRFHQPLSHATMHRLQWWARYYGQGTESS